MTTNLREHQEILLARINKLINALVDNYAKYTKDYQYSSPRNITFDIVPGTKYYKIVQRDSGTSVHAFISKQSGAVFKPASWKAPAKHERSVTGCTHTTSSTCTRVGTSYSLHVYHFNPWKLSVNSTSRTRITSQ
jgi:hypothetical protein